MRIDFDKTAYGKANAKINASLDVLGLMPDGYHELDTVMVSLSLCDDVTVTLRHSAEMCVQISVPGFSQIVPQDAQNTAAKAALHFFDTLGITGVCADIEITKRIPVGAGLGGGSADAAAVLRALNALCGEPYTAEKLREIGLAVGADVPFCIDGGTVRAGGRGEVMTTLPNFPDCAIVLVKPVFSISTSELYTKIDNVKITEHPDTDGLVAAIAAGDLHGAAPRCFNVFEQVLSPDQNATITEIKNTLIDGGALCAAMTGTGSAVFGIFEDAGAATAAKGALAQGYETFLCRPERI